MSESDKQTNQVAIRAFPAEVVASRPLSICIVTFEAVGFWKNGGIATVSTGLAELLSASGHYVTLALTRADLLSDAEFDHAAERYQSQGIEVVRLSRGLLPRLEGPLEGFTSWERYVVYEWLRRRNFDIVHASEHLGETAYCIAARRLGLAFAKTQFWLGCHGPSGWVIEANEELARDVFWIWTDAAERLALQYADVVWAASEYILSWMVEKGYKLPRDRIYRQAYWIPDDLQEIRPHTDGDRETVKELIFFGRLEPRKGIKLFLAAVLRLRERLAGVVVTFMGRQSTIDGELSDVYIETRLRGSGISWQLLDGLDRVGAYNYMVESGRVAVLASPVDNSPCAVYELLEIGARFVACAGGGIPELLDPLCKPFVLFNYTVTSLCHRLDLLLMYGAARPIAAAQLDRKATRASWVGAHATIPNQISEIYVEQPRAFKSAVAAVVYDGCEKTLQITIDALLWLGSLISEIVIIGADRRSTLPASMPEIARVISLDEVNLGDALVDLGSKQIPLLILRSGAALSPEACERLLSGIVSVDAVVPFCFDEKEGQERVVEPVLPGDMAWTLLYGAAKTAGVLSPKGVAKLVGKSQPYIGTNVLIWFDLAVLSGLEVLPLAEPLVNQSAVDRDAHNAADARARMILCSSKAQVGERIYLEIGVSNILASRML